jgi:hypothetical protein
VAPRQRLVSHCAVAKCKTLPLILLKEIAGRINTQKIRRPMKIIILLLSLVVAGNAQSPSSDTTKLLALLGKDIRAKDAQVFLDSIGSAPKIDRYEASEYQGKKIAATSYYSFQDKGLSIRLDERGFITSIFFYAEGVDGFRQFRGFLPYGLEFTMTRADVEKTVGIAASYGGGGVINLWAKYPAKKMSITYDSKAQTDRKVRMQTLCLTAKP